MSFEPGRRSMLPSQIKGGQFSHFVNCGMINVIRGGLVARHTRAHHDMVIDLFPAPCVCSYTTTACVTRTISQFLNSWDT